MSDLDSFKSLKKKIDLIREDDAVLSPPEKLGLAVTLLRKKARVTQVELASSTGLARCSITNIECGKANPSFSVLCSIAEGIGIPVSGIFLLMEAM